MGVELIKVEQELIDLVHVELLLQQVVQPGLQHGDGLLQPGDLVIQGVHPPIHVGVLAFVMGVSDVQTIHQIPQLVLCAVFLAELLLQFRQFFFQLMGVYALANFLPDGCFKARIVHETIDDLSDGAAKLSSGAAALSDGTGKLADGASSLKTGVDALAEGQSSLYDGIAKLQEAMPALTDGVTQLRDGAMELSEGLQTFYDEGISKILEAVDEDLPALLNRLRAISSLSNAYQTFTGIAPDTTGTVKFIYRTEEIGG